MMMTQREPGVGGAVSGEQGKTIEGEAALIRESEASRDPVTGLWVWPDKPRRPVSIDTSVERFIAWMQDEGFTGWQPTAWIDEFYDWYCWERAEEPHGRNAFRTLLARSPGVIFERRRLLGATQAMLRRVLKTERTRFYYIPEEDEQAQAMADADAGSKRRAKPRLGNARSSGRNGPERGSLQASQQASLFGDVAAA